MELDSFVQSEDEVRVHHEAFLGDYYDTSLDVATRVDYDDEAMRPAGSWNNSAS